MNDPSKQTSQTATGLYQEQFASSVSSLVFLRGRERAAGPRLHDDLALTGIGPDAELIELLPNVDEARTLFEELYALQTRIQNHEISSELQHSPEGPRAILARRIFYTIRTIFARKEGVTPEETKLKLFMDLDLRRQYLLSRIGTDLKEAFSQVCKTSNDRDAFVRELLTDVGHVVSPGGASASPPEPTYYRYESSARQDTRRALIAVVAGSVALFAAWTGLQASLSDAVKQHTDDGPITTFKSAVILHP